MAVDEAHSLERELLDAVVGERTPGKARRQVLSALGLLVLLPSDVARADELTGTRHAEPR
jgi:hypothetical protein